MGPVAGICGRGGMTVRFGEGGQTHLSVAPRRVNLIGEHTDYNNGFVLPVRGPKARIKGVWTTSRSDRGPMLAQWRLRKACRCPEMP